MLSLARRHDCDRRLLWFSLNGCLPVQANPNMMVIATQKELQELDVQLLVSGPTWLESETDYDSLNPNR